MRVNIWSRALNTPQACRPYIDCLASANHRKLGLIAIAKRWCLNKSYSIVILRALFCVIQLRCWTYMSHTSIPNVHRPWVLSASTFDSTTPDLACPRWAKKRDVRAAGVCDSIQISTAPNPLLYIGLLWSQCQEKVPWPRPLNGSTSVQRKLWHQCSA